MKRLPGLFATLVVMFFVWSLGTTVALAASWRVDTRGDSGALVQVDLPDAGGKRRTAFVVFEYKRTCDPIFSYAEMTGNRLGTPKAQSVLTNSKIGVVLNGTFYTWHAAITNYDNGFEAGFGIPNELMLQLLVNVDSLSYVTPAGDTIPLPTQDFQRSLQRAIEYCRKRVR